MRGTKIYQRYKETLDQNSLTPIKAIRIKCLECANGSEKGVRECPIKDCSLFIYRMGTNPKRKGRGGNPALSAQS